MPRAVRKDKWKMKTWYDVYAPEVFGGVKIAETPADDPKKLVNRTIEVTLGDITGVMEHYNIKLWFQIHRVEDRKAYTKFKKEMLVRSYLSSIVRRRTSRVDGEVNFTTKDGYRIKAFGLIITAHRVRTSQKSAIRKVMHEIIEKYGRELTLDEFLTSALLDKPHNIKGEIFEKAKKIAPIRHVEMRKIVVVQEPEEVAS